MKPTSKTLAQSNGYSSAVRGWLVMANQHFALSQVGPNFCILREPATAITKQAQLIVEVDGEQRRTDILILDRKTPDSIRLEFRAN